VFPLFGFLCGNHVPPPPRMVKVMDGDTVLGYKLVRDDGEFIHLIDLCRRYAKVEVEDAPPSV
jgi:hypothetical protein